MLHKAKELLFTNRSTKQTIIKNTVWLSASTIVGRVIRAGVVIYAARILGAEGYGIFSYAMSLAAFFSIFSDVGLTGLLTRELSKTNSPGKEDFATTIFYIKGFFLVLTLLVTIFGAPLFIKLGGVEPLIPLAALLVFFDNLRTFGFGLARAKNKMEIEGIGSIATDVIITILSIGALALHPTPFSLSLMYVLGSAGGTIFAFFAIRKFAKEYFGKFNTTLVKDILSTSMMFAIMGVFAALMINIDMVILGFFRDAKELGLYAAAQRPVQLLYVLPSIVAASIFPIISKLAEKREDGSAKKILEKTTRASVLVGLPITLGGVIVAQPLLSLLFGSEYAGSALSFQILLITVFLVFMGTAIGNSMFSYNLQKKLAIATGAGALVNVVFDLLLIPHYGISGSAVATVLSQITLNSLNWYYLKKHIGFSILPEIKKIAVAGACMAIVTFMLQFIGMHVIVSIAISALVYGLVLISIKEEVIGQIFKIVKSARNSA